MVSREGFGSKNHFFNNNNNNSLVLGGISVFVKRNNIQSVFQQNGKHLEHARKLLGYIISETQAFEAALFPSLIFGDGIFLHGLPLT